MDKKTGYDFDYFLNMFNEHYSNFNDTSKDSYVLNHHFNVNSCDEAVDSYLVKNIMLILNTMLNKQMITEHFNDGGGVLLTLILNLPFIKQATNYGLNIYGSFLNDVIKVENYKGDNPQIHLSKSEFIEYIKALNEFLYC